ncbi:hypothetical protein BBP40_006347 [Aspergillus hancockii]|nr:hypothetical protein BBP40_006347 [Aspergillus hancockii]
MFSDGYYPDRTIASDDQVHQIAKPKDRANTAETLEGVRVSPVREERAGFVAPTAIVLEDDLTHVSHLVSFPVIHSSAVIENAVYASVYSTDALPVSCVPKHRSAGLVVAQLVPLRAVVESAHLPSAPLHPCFPPDEFSMAELIDSPVSAPYFPTDLTHGSPPSTFDPRYPTQWGYSPQKQW